MLTNESHNVNSMIQYKHSTYIFLPVLYSVTVDILTYSMASTESYSIEHLHNKLDLGFGARSNLL